MSALSIILIAAGLLQLVAGMLKLGQWFRAVSPAVIHGMLAGIGVLILVAQFHVMLDGKETMVEADTVIVCAGQTSRRELRGHHVIGGAREAGELDAKRAMREGVELGARL